MQNLLKNGSFVQRRKMYAILPFHNLASKIPIDWQPKDMPTLERQRIKEKQIYEQEYIKRTYNDKIDQKLKLKFSLSQQQNEAIINQVLDKKIGNRDSLAQQLDSFNQSKLIHNNGVKNNPQHQIYHKNQANHKQAQLLPSPYVNKKFQQNQQQQYLSHSQPHVYPLQTYNDANLQYQGVTNSRQRYAGPIKDAYNIKTPQDGYNNDRSPERYREQSTPKSYYGYDLKDQHRKYAEFLPPDQPFRNVIPDKLENFLREKTKADRKRTISVNLSMSK